jgi:hypothetical protein
MDVGDHELWREIQLEQKLAALLLLVVILLGLAFAAG